jgi:hypothetical protein
VIGIFSPWEIETAIRTRMDPPVKAFEEGVAKMNSGF